MVISAVILKRTATYVAVEGEKVVFRLGEVSLQRRHDEGETSNENDIPSF